MQILEKDYLDALKHNIKGVGILYRDAKNDLPDLGDAKYVLRRFTHDLFDSLSESVIIQFVDDLPYDYLGEGHFQMFKDYEEGFIRVPTGDDNSKLLGKSNLKFRATHDVLHAMLGKSFKYEDEVDVYMHTAHMFLIWAATQALPHSYKLDVIRMLRSEIVYQSAFKNLESNNEIDQKVVLTD